MFKKLSNLLFDDVEIEEEIIEEPIKVAVKPKTVKVEEVSEPKVELEQKSFVKPKEKSIFINNSQPKPKVEKPVVVSEKKKEDTYTFTPIISPIRGSKKPGELAYEVKTVPNRPKKKTNHLNTIISPMFGVTNQDDDDAQQIVEEHISIETDDQIIEDVTPPIHSDFVNLSLDDLISDDNNNEKKTHYFIGIKGTGMSALANLLDDAGYLVMGSDTSNYVFTEVELKEKGIVIEDFDSKSITSDMVVIAGNSFNEDHVDLAYAIEQGAEVYTYPQFLGKFMNDFVSVAVSGSHGKTTTTSMVADMLRENIPTAHLIGDGRGQVDSGANIIAVEACEYKRHFMDYFADYSVITNLEWDHVDYYKTADDYLKAFEDFANQTRKAVLIFGDDENARNLNINTRVIYYGESSSNDLYATNIVELKSHSSFDVYLDNEFVGNFTINRTGRHMIHNALATIGIGLLVGLDADSINEGLQNYQGARRRFEVSEIGESVVIDDYAHHPTELKVTLEAAITKYPDKKIIAVYHPDRIKRLETFMDEFVEALSLADQAAIGSAVDSDGMIDVIDTGELLLRVDKSFVVDDDLQSVSSLSYLAPAVFVFMGTKEMHTLKEGLIDYLKRIDI